MSLLRQPYFAANAYQVSSPYTTNFLPSKVGFHTLLISFHPAQAWDAPLRRNLEMDVRKYMIYHTKPHSKPICKSDSALQDKEISNIFSNWVFHFKSSKTALHRTLKSFPSLFGDLQGDISRLKQVTHRCSPPSSPPALPSSDLQQQFSHWTPVTVPNFAPIFSRPHIALFPKQRRLCPKPQKHFSTNRRWSTIITRDLHTTDWVQKPEHVKKEWALRFIPQNCSWTRELAISFSASLEYCKKSNKSH